MKRRAMGILAIVSLLLFVAVAWTWVCSFGEDTALLGWKWSADRYAIRSHWGQILFAAPPAAKVTPEPEIELLAARMSNQDFVWTSVGADHVQGEVRERTPTWEMYARVWEDLEDPARCAPAMRVLLRGLEDPRTFAASHLLLLLAAEDRWRARWVDEATQPWREASAAGERLVLFAKADATGSGPDASEVQEVRDRWHALLYEARTRIFVGWVALGALSLPVAWAARPRREPRTRRRWGFNALAVVSVLLLVVSGVMWVRSYGTGEQWMFAAERGAPLAGMHAPMRVQRWIGSVRGLLVWCEHEVPETSYTGGAMLPRPVGYGRYVYDVRRAQTFGATPKEERHWKIAGIEYCGMPAQELKGATAVPGGVAYTSAFYGFRYVIIPWWVPVTLSSLLPLVWACGYASWRRRERRARLIRDRICLRCGYDLRESRGRCPECGEVIIGCAVAREAAT